VLLQKGVDLTVVTRKQNHHVRRFALSPDMTSLDRGKSHIGIKDIKELRRGQNTAIFKAAGRKYDASLCFSIIHGSSYRSLDLVAATREDYDDWMVGLDDLLFTVFEVPRSVSVMSDTHVLAMFEQEVRQQDAKRHHNKHGEAPPSTLGEHAVEKLLFHADSALKTHQVRLFTALAGMLAGLLPFWPPLGLYPHPATTHASHPLPPPPPLLPPFFYTPTLSQFPFPFSKPPQRPLPSLCLSPNLAPNLSLCLSPRPLPPNLPNSPPCLPGL